MNIAKADLNNFVTIELNSKELKIIYELFNAETILQLRGVLTKHQNSVEDQLSSVLQVMELFRNFDQKIIKLMDDVDEVEKLQESENTGESAIAVVSKMMLKFFMKLLETTHKDLPREMTEKNDTYVQSLILKLSEAINSDPQTLNGALDSLGAIGKKPLKEVPRTKTEKQDSDSLPTNIFGIKAQA